MLHSLASVLAFQREVHPRLSNQCVQKHGDSVMSTEPSLVTPVHSLGHAGGVELGAAIAVDTSGPEREQALAWEGN